MIIAQWTCEVPAVKREALLRFVTREMRAIYLAHGCRRHELQVPVASPTKYFPFHADRPPTEYVEQLAFGDQGAFEAFLKAMDADPAARSATARYEAEFGVYNCAFTLLGREA